MPEITGEAVAALKQYPWPGNVRELQNYVERAVVLALGNTLSLDLFPPHVCGLAPVRTVRRKGRDLQTLCSDLVTQGITESGNTATDLHQRIVSHVERELILQVLRECQGVQTKAASRLGINRNTLHKKIEEYGLESEAR